MGKGFQNFMSKKDFHPSAWWNLKKVWEARQKKEQLETRDAEMQVQYEKEQEIFNNKALLGDEKAKMGLSFMYEAPAGMHKREEEKPEPKFEWQRKYNAPRESWAQNNEAIVDHPFGIAVRNVRCVRCHNWGHVNTDSECPLYGKSGNYEEEGYANNPSDLVKEMRKAEKAGKTLDKNEYRGRKKKVEEGEEEEWVPADSGTLAEQMREEHGMKLKANMLSSVKEYEQLEQMGNAVKDKQDKTKNMLDFFNSLSKKEQEKVMRKTLGMSKEEKESKKKSKKDKKKRKKEEKKMKKLMKMKVKKEEPASEDEKEKEKNGRRRRDSSISPPLKRSRRDSDAIEKRKIKEEPLSSDDERNEQKKRNGSPMRKRRTTRSPERSHARSPVRRRRESRSPERSPIRRRRDSPIREKRREEREKSRERKRSPIRHRRESRSPVRKERSPIGKRGETRRRDSRTPERRRSPVRGRKSHTPERKEKDNLVAEKKIKEEPISEDEYERREEEKKKEEKTRVNGGRRSRSKSNDSSSSSSSSSASSSDSGDEKKSEKRVEEAHEYRGKFAKGSESKKSPEKEKRRRDSSGSPPPRSRRPTSPRRRSRSPRRR